MTTNGDADRVLWFYRVMRLGAAADVFLSAAPSAEDAALWRRAAERVVAQRSRWCEGANGTKGAAVLGVDPAAGGGRGAATIGVTVNLATRKSAPTKDALVEAIWAEVTKRATTAPFGTLAGILQTVAQQDEPAADGAESESVVRQIEGLVESVPRVPCTSVWCAWCRGDDVVVAGRAYGDEPEALELPGLGFPYALSDIDVLPASGDESGQDAVGIRERLDAAFGTRWRPSVPPDDAPDADADPVLCIECFDKVCHAMSRAIAVRLPSKNAQSASNAAAETLLRCMEDAGMLGPEEKE